MQTSLVFISHSSKDKLVADAITARLEAQEIPCWIAPRDILPGKDYSAQIVEALRRCSVVVVVFSKWTNASRHIHSEVDRAFNLGKTIIPFRIDEARLDESLEYYLSKTHWLEAISPPLEAHIDRLRAAIFGIASTVSPPPPRRKLKAIVTAAVAIALILGGSIYLSQNTTWQIKADRATADQPGQPKLETAAVPSSGEDARPTSHSSAPATTGNPMLDGANAAMTKISTSASAEQLATIRKIFAKVAIKATDHSTGTVRILGAKWAALALDYGRPGTPKYMLQLVDAFPPTNYFRSYGDGLQKVDWEALMEAPQFAWIYAEGTPGRSGEFELHEARVIRPEEMNAILQSMKEYYGIPQ